MKAQAIMLGATLQAQYRCPQCQKIMEKRFHCDSQTELKSGLRWMDNDVVNGVCSLCGALFVWLGTELLNW